MIPVTGSQVTGSYKGEEENMDLYFEYILLWFYEFEQKELLYQDHDKHIKR